MYGVFADTIIRRIDAGGMSSSMRGLSKAIRCNDTGRMGTCPGDLLQSAISGRVLDNEHAYQAFVTGLLMSLFRDYDITADFESGDEYHDIRLKRLRGSGPDVVIEIKRMTGDRIGEDELRSAAEKALDQIVDRDCAHGMDGMTVQYGVAFSGKTPAVSSKIQNAPE